MSNKQENREQQPTNPNSIPPEKRKPEIQPVKRRDFHRTITKDKANKIIKKNGR